VIESITPVDAVVRATATHDLTVLGVGEGWQLEPNLFGFRSERLVAECPSSLLVVRGKQERRAS
jgi:nucleotide-binding universal stress UspA family protein